MRLTRYIRTDYVLFMANKVTTIHIPEETIKRLDAWAKRIDRSRNWLISEAIEAYMEADEKLTKAFKKAGKIHG